ncbi:unnamed protein product [Spodoptera exigua]|nr:unnamed protein product [Spodoptera exigua]
MANTLDLKLVLKHLSNGTLSENLCIICLEPLRDQSENIFTKVCKYDKEYCIADVLQTMCDITLSDTDTYNICINCFMMASMAYKFYLLSKRSQEILGFYTNELLENMEQIQLPEEMVNNTLCISLPEIATVTPVYDYNLQSIGKETELFENTFVKQEITKSEETDDNDNDKVVVIIQDNGEPAFYRAQPDGSLIELEESEGEKYRKKFKASIVTVKKEERLKKGRKRGPMSFKMCSRCPVKYRFITKLKQHMMMDHNVTLFVCKVCQAFTENEQEYHNHMKTHTDIHQCAVCNTVFKKRSTIINHLKWHERMKNITENALQTENAHICEKCGKIMFDEESLRQHYDSVHYKKFTCYYCGRMYKGEMSFDSHIKKHEKNMEIGSFKDSAQTKDKVNPSEKAGKARCMCSTCGRHFVDERALLWHQRLHNNERPYPCKECGRRFVSLNRRNQHALCAHTAPTRRCPLCPALFHLRSMVNSHVKKVHLREHKRRNRVNKHRDVPWRTAPVPIQELSVDIQNDILELQAAHAHANDWTYEDSSQSLEMEHI